MARPVIGPLGNVLTLESLPPANTIRWSKRRKCELLAAIEGGLLSPSEACSMYRLSMDEVLSWRHAVAHSGIEGLSARRPRDASRASVGIPPQQLLLNEINRLVGLAQANGAAPTAVLLQQAAAELRTVDHQYSGGACL
jgi:hypothetical protein